MSTLRTRKGLAYTATISIVRNGNTIISDSKPFVVKKTNPIQITLNNPISISIGSANISGVYKNTHTKVVNDGVLFAAVYENGAMTDYKYQSISNVISNTSDIFYFDLTITKETNTIIKLFAIDNQYEERC